MHIRDVLDEINTESPGLITKFGGHAMAAGLSLKPEGLADFSVAFDRKCQKHMAGLPTTAQIFSDGALPEAYFSLDFAQLLQRLGPWGQGFQEPVFDNVMQIVQQRVVGEKHLKLVFQVGSTVVDGIAFNVDLGTWPNPAITHAHVAFTLSINEFRGRQSVQCMVIDLSPDLPSQVNESLALGA